MNGFRAVRNRLKKALGAAAKPEKEEKSEETGDIALIWLVDPGHYRSAIELVLRKNRRSIQT